MRALLKYRELILAGILVVGVGAIGAYQPVFVEWENIGDLLHRDIGAVHDGAGADGRHPDARHRPFRRRQPCAVGHDRGARSANTIRRRRSS